MIVGAQVQARHNQGAVWYHGKVTDVNADGTYGVRYDDGDVEANVARFRLRVVGWQPKPVLSVGDRADCHHAGGEQVYPATVAGVNADGTYEIHYDDGDKESGVKRGLIQAAFVPADRRT